jgi:hypothetical protein
MSQSRKTNVRFGNVNAQTANIDGFVATPQIILDAGAVTQTTSITTAVTLPSSAGIITTVAASTGTSGSSTFTASHPDITASNVVLASIVGYTGTGLPTVRLNTTEGSMSVTIQNTSVSAPLNAALRISYLIL